MSYEFKQKLCPAGLGNNPNRDMKSIGYVTIHNTGNYAATATAESHAKYQYNGSGGTQRSWHYTVDDKEVWQSFEDTRECWHAGDGSGPGNTASIGVEICVNDRDNFKTACENAAKLVADLLRKHGLPVERVVQHNDWTGKNCPSELRSGAWGVSWNGFLEMVWLCVEDTGANAGTPIIGPATARLEQAKAWAKDCGATDVFISLAGIFWAIAGLAGVNPVAAYCQSAKETGYGKFPGVLDEAFRNPCGLKTAQGGGNDDPDAHQRFDSWEQGILAQTDHLALYAGADGYPKPATPDPRHFPYLLGKSKTVEELGGEGRWSASATYGHEIVKLMGGLESTAALAPNVPDWQTAAFEKLIRNGTIGSPEYWENRLADTITVGEVFAVVASMRGE